ncbi:MAG: hypothetical protein JW797_09845 [Bradymonadales bacterium]|nr:hypothetical protein [Bradymonadales bacterium]
MRARICYLFVAALAAAVCLSCQPDIGEDPPVSVVTAVLDPITGVLPMPNDILLDPETGLVAVPDLPTDDVLTLAIKQDLRRLDGWSAYSPVSAPFDGPLDRDTICMAILDPSHPDEAILQPEGCDPISIYLVNSTQFGALPQVQWDYEERVSGDQTTGHIHFLPVEPYRSGATYLAVMTEDLKGAGHEPVVESQVIYFSKSEVPLVDNEGNIENELLMPQPGQTMEEAQATAQDLETLRRAYALPYLVLQNMGIDKASVVHLWGFTVQSITDPLMAMRQTLYEGNGSDCPSPTTEVTLSCPPPDMAYLADACGTNPILSAETVYAALPGVPHDHIAGVTFGTITSANFLDPDTGRLAIDAEGNLSCSHEEIWFTLALPDNPPTTPYPVVIMQHGLLRSRHDLLRVADYFAAEGYAVVGIDAVFHGARSHNLLDIFDNRTIGVQPIPTAGADGIPDCSGAGLLAAGPVAEEDDPLGCYDADYPYSLAGSRDNFRQSVADMLQLTRALDAEDGFVELEGVELDGIDIGFFGQSLGSELGVLYLAVEPEVRSAVLGGPAGGFANIIHETRSPQLGGLVSGLLEEQGIERDSLAYWELLNTIQWMLDPADPINFARYVLREPLVEQEPKRLLLLWANDDEVFPLATMEALAMMLGINRDDPEQLKWYGTVEAPVGHSFIITPDERNPDQTRMALEDAASFIASEED